MNRRRWLSAIAVAAAISTASACASGGFVYAKEGPHSGYGDYSGYRANIERIAHQNGYHEGREAGETDARRGRCFSVERHDDWRDADEGYRREYGDRDFYRHEFREGFVAGYRDGLQRARARLSAIADGCRNETSRSA